MNEIDPKLSRAYRAASTEVPPPALDVAILAAARQRLTAPRRRRQAWWSRWMVPASVMATLVLGVSLAFLIEREQPETTDAEPAGRAPASATAADADKEKVGAGPTAPAAGRGAADQAGARRAPVMRQAAPQASAVEARQIPLRAPAEPAPTIAPGATTAPAALPAAPAASRRLDAADSVTAGEAKSESATTVRERVGDIAPAPSSEAKAASPQLQAAPRPPQAWLDEILRLRREGHEQEAARQLDEFRRAYPAYRLPESLSR